MSAVRNGKNVYTLLCSRKVNFGTIVRNNSGGSSAPASYCVELVRKYDYENFLCTLLLPRQLQSLGFAVRAFNIEVAKIQDQVSQVHAGQMRLAFWLESVDRLFKNDVREHPVVIELHRALKGKKMSKHHLKHLVQARMNPISSSSFRSLEDMEKYAESSVAPIYYIMLEEANLGSTHSDHAASHLSKAQGITNMLRSIPYTIKNRSLPMPQDLLVKHSVSQEKIFRSQTHAELKEIVYEVASRAKQHLDKARNLKKQCPKEVSLLFLPAICTGSYLNRLQYAEFNIFNEHLRRRNNLLHIQLYWNKLFFRY